MHRRRQEKAPLLDTLGDLVAIESGSGDREARQDFCAHCERRRGGGEVDLIDRRLTPTAWSIRPTGRRMVQARSTGAGAKKILLIAPWTPGLPTRHAGKQPLGIEETVLTGFGIADDKQGVR